MTTLKFTLTQINTKFMEWTHNPRKQRLGQFLINQFQIADNSDIFYEKDSGKAYHMFCQKFANNLVSHLTP